MEQNLIHNNKKTKKILSSNLFTLGIIVVVMIIAMTAVKPDYLSGANILVLSRSVAVYALIGFSQMISLSSGGMNLSVGATGAMAAVMAGFVMEVIGGSALMAMVVGMVAALACGVLNGLLIYRNGGVGVASFLVTLATSSVFYGIILTITESKPYYNILDSFNAIGNTTVLGVSSSLIIMIVIAVVLFVMYKRTKLGKQILAFGANSKAAELYGVSRFKTVMAVNIIAALLAGFAGLMVVCRIGSAQPDIGSDWMLLSFSTTLIGGAYMNGGKVNVWGTILGALIVVIVENALVHLKVDIYWNELFNGAMILIVVAAERIKNLRQSRISNT